MATIGGGATEFKRQPLSADACERYPGPPSSSMPTLCSEQQSVLEDFAKAVIRWNSERAEPASREETLQFAATWFHGRRPRRRSRTLSTDTLAAKAAVLNILPPSPEATTWSSSGMRV